ncbi:MAG: peptidyl-prolyl cis-trans isomerase, partial [Spirochaetales bacterium]|nr:peptidyl-prolyl cis-trans isomerase [Candidatus Physcosoma equi]
VKADVANDIPEPTEKEIKAWYRQNAASNFTEPEMVRLSVIAKAKTGDEAKDKENYALLTKAAEEIKNGTVSFERAVQLYTDDTASLSVGGDWGFLMDQESTRQTMGNAFVDEAMLLEEGEFTGVRETPSLYVIAKCTVHLDPRILGLEDVISSLGVTVSEYIRQGLMYQNSQIAFYNAYDALIADLKSQARINILYK